MPRGPRLDVEGGVYQVMARGVGRRAIFRNDTDRQNFLRRLTHRPFLWALRVVSCLTLIGCGGGGDSWLFPLWVPTDVVVTDVDDDGRADVLTLAMLSTSMSHREGRLVVYRQASPGVFAAPDTYVVGIYPWKLSVGDLDGDGLPDLVVTDPEDGRAVSLLWQDPRNPGRFLPPQQIASDIVAYEAAIADLNGDGAPDIAIANDSKSAHRLLLRYQDPGHRGTFLPALDFTMPGTPSNVAAGDLNGDGQADVLTWIYLASSGYTPNGALAISLQQPDGMLGPVTTLAPQTGLNVGLLAIADYDGDGRNDLFVFFTPYSSDYHAKLTVLLQGSLPGTFAGPVDTSLAGIQGIDGAAVADLNGDGRPDVAVAGFFPVGSPSTVKSRLNTFAQAGGGAFALAGVYDMPIAVSRVAAGDVDGDGRNDLVVLGGDNQCLVLIHSHTVPGTFSAPRPLS
jgi:hypothetical protein